MGTFIAWWATLVLDWNETSGTVESHTCQTFLLNKQIMSKPKKAGDNSTAYSMS